MQAQPLSLPAVPEPTYGERLKNKVVIVTGAAQGIGEAIVACFQAQQARLIIADIQGDKVEKIAAHWREHGAQVYAHAVDITSKDQWQALVNLDGVRMRIDVSKRSLRGHDRPPEIHEAVHNLRHALHSHHGHWSPEEIVRVAALLNGTAQAIADGRDQ